MHKIQITLTSQENDLLAYKAAVLGYDTTKFIKFIASREAFSVVENVPTFILSPRAEKMVEKALKNHKQGKTVELGDINELDNL